MPVTCPNSQSPIFWMPNGFSLGVTEGFINNTETAFKIRGKFCQGILKVREDQERSEEFYLSVGSVFVFFKGAENCNYYYICIDRTAGKSCCQTQPGTTFPLLAEAETFQEQPLVSSPNTFVQLCIGTVKLGWVFRIWWGLWCFLPRWKQCTSVFFPVCTTSIKYLDFRNHCPKYSLT